ncbi:hypothetical protein Agabi119p4_3715 [Agaricus bisporus var. burnettii]|uniref:Cytochrome P450 n=1 Tax=Agaricus bisporus var. burnettii TaxID=192524 RepID=A0A8H7F588_AGABI|nr:hypothetical protein Agabi119p4_3715 [Agaricus bisporus var. burnettii]
MLIPIPNIWLISGASVGFYVLLKAYPFFHREFNSTLRSLPGLSSWDVFTGNIKQLILTDQTKSHTECIKAYGPTFKFKAILGETWLFSADVKAINHILKKDTVTWEKPIAMAYNLMRLLGPGVLLVISDVHRRQRKILNPAFASGEVKRFMPLFLDKAVKLKDIWSSQIQQNDDQPTRIDMLSWLSRATLDVIGEAGFGYEFNSLTEDPGNLNELHEAFKVLFEVGNSASLLQNLRGLIPFLRLLRLERDADIETASETMRRIGKQLLSERELAFDPHNEKAGARQNDILSLLVRANASGEADQRIPAEQILAQIPTFMAAGHETTSTATTWALFELAKDSHMQQRLREELLNVATQSPTVDELNALTYLDAVIRETMRLHSPVPMTIRLATEDDVLPLQTPVVDKFGKLHHEIRILKGQGVLIPFDAVNRLSSIWGDDAERFNPDRWNSPPEAAMSVPGIWGNLMTFSAGPRACIGFRFSLIEMKALLFTLVRAFEFNLAVPPEDIGKMSEIVMRPVLKTDPVNSNQLPLLVRPVIL